MLHSGPLSYNSGSYDNTVYKARRITFDDMCFILNMDISVTIYNVEDREQTAKAINCNNYIKHQADSYV